MEAKATVKVGPCSRRGQRRVAVAAAAHDVQPTATVTPVGLLLPATDALFLYGGPSKVTSDCLVDGLTRWWAPVRERFAQVTTLVIDLANGPAKHRRRTPFMSRLVAFARQAGPRVRLAYSPPSPSKDNPIERCWGILEQHGNGARRDALATVPRFAEPMTWKGQHPVVELVTTA